MTVRELREELRQLSDADQEKQVFFWTGADCDNLERVSGLEEQETVDFESPEIKAFAGRAAYPRSKVMVIV